MRQALIRANGVLKSHGFVNYNPTGGDTVIFVADDFNLDPEVTQWNGSAWVTYTPPPAPNITGFVAAIKGIFVNAVGLNAVAKQYPLLYDHIVAGTWSYVQDLIIDANTNAKINPTQYAAIKAACTTNNIPVTLP